MENTLYIAASRQTALRRQLEIVANNMANMNTGGFKADSGLFTEYLNGERRADRVSMVNDMGIKRDTSAGPLTDTGNPLDLAIEGDGYFMVQTEQGIAYTRAGSFRLNQDGEIVSGEGNPLVGLDQAPFVVPPEAGPIQISHDGVITAGDEQIGIIDLVRFDRQQEMKRLGGALLQTEEAPLPVEEGKIHQGMLEGSNVQPIVEITRMIEIQRAYESTSRLVERQGQTLEKMVQTLTRAS